MLLRGVAMVTMATDFKDMKNPLPWLLLQRPCFEIIALISSCRLVTTAELRHGNRDNLG